jgi:hypothetical protein
MDLFGQCFFLARGPFHSPSSTRGDVIVSLVAIGPINKDLHRPSSTLAQLRILVERIALIRSAVETGYSPLADIKKLGIGTAF